MMALAAAMAMAAPQNSRSDWSKPFPPHKVIGNVYFVGSVNLGSYLIATPPGSHSDQYGTWRMQILPGLI